MLLTHYSNTLLEAGCNEAGRGCLAGPVFAAAVILPKDYINLDIKDSKKLSERKRDKLRVEIEKEAIYWSVAAVTAKEIDEVTILNASILAMHKALNGLNVKPTFILVDGNKFKPYQSIKHSCIIKGDAKYYSIAAASILAKTYRDEYMVNLSKEFVKYQWENNKGYPTKIHRDVIKQIGICKHHRKSFSVT